MNYINSLYLPSDHQETGFLMSQRRTYYNGCYPYKIFPQKGLSEINFAPITIFYGGNGSGKTTLLNVIAEKTNVLRHSAVPFPLTMFRIVKLKAKPCRKTVKY